MTLLRFFHECIASLRHETEDPYYEVTGLTLDQLALSLPPTEQILLEHLRGRQPLETLIGKRGFCDVRRRNRRLRRLLSRVDVYCGADVRECLIEPYDMPGGHRRRGRPRTFLDPAEFPAFEYVVPQSIALAPPPHLKIICRIPTLKELAEAGDPYACLLGFNFGLDKSLN